MAEESLNSGNDVKRIETLLGLDLDEKDEARVAIYIQQAKQAIMVYIQPYLEYNYFPTEFNYLVDQLALTKYNKFHNEGVKSISEEGLSMTFDSNDLTNYLPDIQAWIDSTGKDASQQGRAVGWY